MIRRCIRAVPPHSLSQLGRCGFSTSRWLLNELTTPKVNYEAKYAEKLQKRAIEQGLSIEQLKQKLREEETTKRKEKAAVNAQTTSATPNAPSTQVEKDKATSAAVPPVSIPTRKDSSPVKPLTELLNLEKLLQTPHTAEQISLLWRAYHASRSKGTGRGYLCATIPLDAYHKMASVASKYPCFILPVPREGAQIAEEKTSEDQKAYEMYFMEWGFHSAPPEPKSSITDLFTKPTPSNNPKTSTILFTPLQEYKQRTSFATPYLVLTNYTDLASSHGIVLSRGEITPSTSGSIDAGGDGRYMLSQQDAQLLAMGIQKFYLWSEDQGKGERQELLRTFHDNPEGFKWEELLKHTDFSA
ncbi:ATP11-domain-containing protein [Irpex rosettiformis]|uniref:ATP11-domain-containing protein n=1 Tax=Irpex rosettiformis TaxID=378272 RepID=A0ACB8U6N9_9APHY|nr:ATP11-domain-containing protein [Irpex rosettiformis]